MRCFFRGFSLLARSPEAYGLALVPIAVAFIITIGFSALSLFFVPALVERWAGSAGWWVEVLKLLALATFLIFSVLLGIALAQPASGPALEALVRKTERKLGMPEHPQESFTTGIARSAGSALIGLGSAFVAFVVLALIGLIPGAAIVTVPLQFVSTAFCIGWDLCDYPLSVRGVPLKRRVAVVFGNLRAVMGLSFGLGLCALVPCGFLLLLPIGVVGATALVRDLEAADRVR